jgi:magnesium transporter
MLQANLTKVPVRQTEDMRRISAWVAIWAVPTLLTGVYGMNFQHMPELAWPVSYPLGLYCAFRRSGWL